MKKAVLSNDVLAQKISKKVRSLMKPYEHMSQRELAKAIGLQPMSFNRVVRAEVTPTADILLKIADFFEVTTDEILCRKVRKKEHATT